MTSVLPVHFVLGQMKDFPARFKRPRHQPRATIRGRLFGLLRRRD
jgi:hypothetical protein